VESAPKRGERAPALIEIIWCQKIRGCSYRRRASHSLPADRDQLLLRREMTRWATSDEPCIEHNESALTPAADMPADMDFRCNGPQRTHALQQGALEITMAA